MTSPTRSAGPPDGADLPAPVVAALDEIESGLADTAPPADPAKRTLAEDVAHRLHRRIHDPITRVLLSRPKIFSWCLEQALRPADPPGYRVAEPLAEQPATPNDRTEAARGPSKRRKGTTS